MGGMPSPIPNMPLPLALVFLALSLAINLAGVLVALDARERGLSKASAILWYFAVIALFGLPAAFYLLIRNNARPGRGGGEVAPSQQGRPEPRQEFCPYCGAPRPPGSRICPSCGKLL